MSLYRTWRPRTFADLVGQDAVVKTLTTALETGRLAHAYLFSGPRGSGKTSAAKILARCIECVNGPTATPDNTCENCVAILEGSALDVLEIDAASNRGIDEIRALRDAVKFTPAAMRKKVYIIDEAHMLTKEGANAFLKTLEEPPDWAVFILATTAPEALPPTILSRCQRYAFRRIAIPTMIARMREIAGAEGIPVDDGALGAIAYRADGGLRDALTMLEQVSSFAGEGAVDAETVEAAFGQTGRAFARALRDVTLDGDAAAALRIIDEASDAGTDMSGLIRSTLAEFRHLLVARVNAELLARDLAEDDARAARERAAATPQARLVRALRLLADALASARNSGNARLELESAVLRFVLQGEDPTLDALASRLAALESGAGARVPMTVSANAHVPPMPAVGAPPRGPNEPHGEAAAQPRRAWAAATAVAEAHHADDSDLETLTAEDPEPAAPLPAEPRNVPNVEAPGSFTATGDPHPDNPDFDLSTNIERSRPPGVVTPALTFASFRSRWDMIRRRAEEQKKSLSAGLSRAVIESLSGDVVVLRLPSTINADIVKKDLATLKAAILEVTLVPIEVRIVTGPPLGGQGIPSRAAVEEPPDLARYAEETLPK